MKIGSNIDINRDRKQLPVAKPDVPKTVIDCSTWHGRGNKVAQSKDAYWKAKWWKNSHENFDCGSWADCLSFLVKINGIIIIHDRWYRGECISLYQYHFIFSRRTNHAAKEHNRHELAEENLQRARDK